MLQEGAPFIVWIDILPHCNNNAALYESIHSLLKLYIHGKLRITCSKLQIILFVHLFQLTMGNTVQNRISFKKNLDQTCIGSNYSSVKKISIG